MPVKLLIVIRREYLQRVRSKGFLIFTLLFPLLMAGYIAFIISISHSGSRQQYRIAVLDKSGHLFAPLSARLEKIKFHQNSQFLLTSIPDTGGTAPALAGMVTAVLRKHFDGALVISPGLRRVRYYARDVTNFYVLGKLQSAVGSVIQRQRLLAAGLPARKLAKLLQPVNLRQYKVTRNGAKADQGQTFALAYVLSTLLYIAIIIYGISVMRGVAEEKTGRIAEVVLAAVDPFTLMLGKIIGLGAAGLTQFAVWLGCVGLVIGYSMMSSNAALQHIPHLGPAVFLLLIVYFILGFLLYATLYAAAGAIISNEQDMQQTQMPITLILVLSVILIPAVLTSPASFKAVLLSEIPFFAPVLMVTRLTASHPPSWQIGLSLALMLAGIVVIIRFAAKVYRIGILMTGKRPTLPELLRWLKAA